jgi:hypothetical protein
MNLQKRYKKLDIPITNKNNVFRNQSFLNQNVDDNFMHEFNYQISMVDR